MVFVKTEMENTNLYCRTQCQKVWQGRHYRKETFATDYWLV